MFGGGGAGQGPGTAPGQPFAGIPPELEESVNKVLEKENPSDSEDLRVEFSHSQAASEDKPFSLWRFIAPYWPPLLLALLLTGMQVVSKEIAPILVKFAVDDGIREGAFSVVALTCVIFVFALFLNYGTHAARTAFVGRIGERLLFSLRIRVFSHLQRLSLDFYNREKQGRVMTRMTSDIEHLQQLFHDGLVNLVMHGLTLVFVTGALFWFNVRLAMIVVFGIVPLMFLLTVWFRVQSDNAFLRVRDRLSDILADLAENLGGMRVVASFNRQRHNSIKHRNVSGEHLDATLSAARISGGYIGGMEAIGVFGQLLVLGFGGWMVIDGTLTHGELAGFVMFLTSFFAPIQQLVQLYNMYQQGRAAIRKLRELLLERPTVAEDDDAYPLPTVEGDINLENVTFSYVEGEPVLDDLSLHIRAGESFALVGPTGAGKTTIVKLVNRMYDPQRGRVLVDGHDIRHVTLESLRKQTGYVPQEPFLFAGTMRDNITFARPEASEEEVLAACEAVGISDLIERLPYGLDTPCHERGVTLSSGERQLIALARAFISQPRIIILDEATSNLDLGTEAKIERALDVLLEGRTALLIAHRLSTAMRADRIAVVDHGGILELGSHDELVAQGGRYARMFETWVRHGGRTDDAVEAAAAGHFGPTEER